MKRALDQHRPRARRRCSLVSPALLFFVWMLSLSLKYEIDNGAYPPVLIPSQLAWKNYADVSLLEPLPAATS